MLSREGFIKNAVISHHIYFNALHHKTVVVISRLIGKYWEVTSFWGMGFQAGVGVIGDGPTANCNYCDLNEIIIGLSKNKTTTKIGSFCITKT